MVLTNRKLLALHKALGLIKDVDADTAWLMAQNIMAVGDAVRAYETARGIISQTLGVLPGQQVTMENAKAVSDWTKQIEELKDKDAPEVKLEQVARAKLQRDKGISGQPSLLADLAPVIKESSPPAP